MKNNDTEQKLSSNTARLVGISALRRIRTLVDGYEKQDNKNKIIAILLVIVLLALLSTLMYQVINRTKEPDSLIHPVVSTIKNE